MTTVFARGLTQLLTLFVCITAHAQTGTPDSSPPASAVADTKANDAPIGHTEITFPDLVASDNLPADFYTPNFYQSGNKSRVCTPEDRFLLDGIDDIRSLKMNSLARSRLMSDSDPSAAPDQQKDDSGDAETSERLPSAVDNSRLSCFPSVGDQGAVGACTCFSAVYYVASHNIALGRAMLDNGQAKPLLLSPFFSSPILCDGDMGWDAKIGGADSISAMRFLEDHGAPSLARYPYPAYIPDGWDRKGNPSSPPPPQYYRPGPTDADVWREALHYRCRPFTIEFARLDGTIDKAGLHTLKTLLADGFIASVPFDVGGTWQNWNLQGPEPQAMAVRNGVHADDLICYNIKPLTKSDFNPRNHVLTVVGYDDTVTVNVNRDGRMVREKGALKLVDSHGTQADHDGFIWIFYDAAISHFTEGALSVLPLEGSLWHAADHRQAEFTISTTRRNQIIVSLGISTTAVGFPTMAWEPTALGEKRDTRNSNFMIGSGGPYAFDGGTNEMPGTFVFTLDELINWAKDSNLKVPDGRYRFYLQVTGLDETSPTTISDFKITDGDGNVLVRAQPDKLPVKVGKETISIALDCPTQPDQGKH